MTLINKYVRNDDILKFEVATRLWLPPLLKVNSSDVFIDHMKTCLDNTN